jgi:hypothetical protein
VFEKGDTAMQHALRPYATAGVALVGASIIAVTPMLAQSPSVQMRPVKLVDAWSTLLSDTTTNLDAIVGNASTSDITQVFSALLTNPLGVLTALTNLDPTVTTDASGLPITVGVQLTPALEMGLAQLGAEGATLEAVNGVLAQLAADPSNALSILYEGTATILNAGLNGADNVSLLGGIIDIPVFNGLLAPETSMTVDLNLTDLVNALGLGSLNLSDLNLTDLLNQIGLGDLTIGSLFSDLNLSNLGLGTLLGDPTLSGLLGDLGLGNLDGGNFGLTTLLTDLHLNTDLGDVTLTQVLNALGLNTDVGSLSLTGLITDLFPNGINVGGVGLGTLLGDLNLITPLAGDLNGVLNTLLGPEATLLNAALKLIDPNLNITNIVSAAGLTSALNELTLGSGESGGTLSLTQLLTDLGLGSTSTGDLGSITTLLGDLGITLPSTSDLTISSLITDVLHELNVSIPSTGDLSLSTLLGDLGIDPNVGTLLDTVTLGGLLTDLGISGDLLNLGDLGNLTNLDLSGLLGDLGLGDLATVTIDPFGGLITELVDTVPGQILAAL